MKFLTAVAVAALVATVSARPQNHDVFKKHVLKAKGIEAHFMEFGATITNLFVEDRHGVLRDVIAGYDDTRQYHLDPHHPYFGPVVGRYANRIGKAEFKLDGKTYHTPANNNGNTLHGGFVGFDYRNWTLTYADKTSLVFEMTSPDGDQGFPGEVKTKVTYSVNDRKQWSIDYEAVTNKDTIVMLSQHTYWNLNAWVNNHTTAEDLTLWINADKYIKGDENLIPTGEIRSVKEDKWMDFTKPKLIGQDIAKSDCGTNCTGYDHCWILNNKFDKPVLTLSSQLTGIKLAINTDQPAMQFYSCNGQDGTIPRKKDQQSGSKPEYYTHWGCLVLETENYIDSIQFLNHKQWPEWSAAPSPILRPGEKYTQHTQYTFSNI